MVFNIGNKLACVALLCVPFCFCSGAQEKIFIFLEPKDVQDLWQQSEICSKEVGYPVSALKEIFKWPIPDTSVAKQIYYCARRNIGYSDKDGHLIIDKYTSLKRLNGTTEDVAAALEECNKITLEDPVATSVAIGGCIHKFCTFVGNNKKTGGIDILF